MKKKQKRRWIIAASIVLPLVAIISFSAFKVSNIFNSKAEMYYEMKSFFNDEILPVLEPLRVELEQELTADEKAKIESLREKAGQLIEQKAEMFKKHHQGADCEKIELTDDEKEAIRLAQKEVRNILTEAWVIMDNHEEKFIEIHENIEPYLETWKKEGRERMMKHLPKMMHGKKGPHCQREGEGHPGHRPHPRHMDGFVTPVIFILWDTETNFPFNEISAHIEDHINEMEQNEKPENDDSDVSIYPNPATTACSVTFVIEEAANVTINVIDKNHARVKQVLNSELAAGTYTEKISLDGFSSGLYFIEIVTGNDVERKKLIVK